MTAWSAAVRHPLLSDVLATAGYLSLCFVTWITLGHARLTANMAELRIFLGAVAWSLFGIAWVRSRYATTLPATLSSGDSPRVVMRSSRRSVGGIAHVVVALLLVAVTFLRLGMPKGDGRGVLITAIAIAWALWLLAASGILAERFEQQIQGNRTTPYHRTCGHCGNTVGQRGRHFGCTAEAMTMGAAFLRIIPGFLVLFVSTFAVLAGLLRLSSGKDAMGLYWVVVGLLILRGVRSRANTDSKQ